MLEIDGESLKVIWQWGLSVGGILVGGAITYIGARHRRSSEEDDDDEDRPLSKRDVAKLLDERRQGPPADRVTKADLLEAMAKLTEGSSRERASIYAKIEASQASTKLDIQGLEDNIREWVRDVDRKFGEHDKRIRENEIALAGRPRR